MNGIDEFRYETPEFMEDLCNECWEEKASHWGTCPGCYWKKESEAHREEDEVQGYE